MSNVETSQRAVLAEQKVRPPEIVGVTDLGPGNDGSINAAKLQSPLREQVVRDCSKPEYRKPRSNRFRCVDGRLPQGGLHAEESEMADPQGAGGEPVFQPMVDYMIESEAIEPLSAKTARHTRQAILFNRRPVVHGDTHKGKGGCGAGVTKREVLLRNAENIDVVAPKAWFLVEQLNLDRPGLLERDDVTELIMNGRESAENDDLWDVTPEEAVDVAIENGAEYEELIDEHLENLIVADVSGYAFDEEKFMREHHLEDGTSIEAFVASMGAYMETAFEDAERQGFDLRHAARRVLGFVLFNVGVPKKLTAEEAGGGEALPVVVIK